MTSNPVHDADAGHGFYGNERFELCGCLGEGGFGVVYRAYDRLRETEVALKVLRSLGPDTVFYFKREFRSLADLDHPNLVRYRELFEEQGRWFLTMDLVEGVPLTEHVLDGDRRGAPPTSARLDRLRHAFAGVAAALRALHGAGKVHRDVKPRNLRVDPGGHVVLLDFGLVTDHDVHLRRAGGGGTAAYMAPEQVDLGSVGPEADWYAVGAMLYECLTGRVPFVGEPESVLRHKRVELPRPPGEVCSGVPADLEQLCTGLLATQPELRREAIASFEGVLGGSSRAAELPTPPAPTPGFVGREAELDAISSLLLAPGAPSRSVAYVYGESGLGKTALLEELQRRIAQRAPDTLVFSGRCYERETVPYKALDGVLDALVHHLGELPLEAARQLLPRASEKLVQAFPAFGRVRAIERAPTGMAPATSQGARQRAFEVLRELLVRLGQRRRFVMIIDDLHWADGDSLSLLEALFGEDRSPACLLLLSGRTRPASSDPVARTLERLYAAVPPGHNVHLGPLGRHEAYTLALRNLRGRPDAGAVSTLIARESGGHPLFVRALVRHVLGESFEGPVSLSAALLQVFDQLGSEAQRLGVCLALSSVALSRDAGRTVTRLSPNSFERALRELVREGWVRLRRADGTTLLELIHDRVRTLLGSRLDATERSEIHWQLAQALVEHAADPEAVAIHFAEAGDAERAGQYAAQGAEAAARSFAFAHAERLYLLALTHLPEDDRARRRPLERQLARVHQLAGRGRQAGDLYAELMRDARDPTEARELRFRAAEAWLDSGHHEEGLPWMEALLADLGVRVADRGLAGVAARLTAWTTVSLRRHSYIRRDAAYVTVRERLTADALWKLTGALYTLCPRRARHAQVQHLAFALDLGDTYRLARALALQGWIHPAPRGPRARRVLERDLREAKRLAALSERPHALALAQASEGLSELSGEHYASAAQHFAAAERLLREDCSGVRWELSHIRLFAAICAWHIGDFRLVARAVASALQDAEACGDVLSAWVWRSRLGHLPHLFSHAPELAAHAVAPDATERGLSAAPERAELHAALSRAEVALYRNDAGAFEALEADVRRLQRGERSPGGDERLRHLWLRARTALCSARLVTERRAEFLREAQRSARLLARTPSAAARARAALIQAAVHELQGRVPDAVRGYRRASQLSESAGLWAMVATADARRGELSGGEQGAFLRRQAHGYLRDAGAVDPARIAAVLNGF